MSKLEEKLIELGYGMKYDEEVRIIYFKWVNKIWRIAFEIDDENIKDISLGVGSKNYNKDEIDEDEYLINAYNEMRKDLGVLNKYEM